MPIYEYECRACGKRFDRLQSFKDEPVRVCPTCGGETRRVIQPVGVIFKGSGWYVTDSRKPGAESKPADGAATKAEGGESKATAAATADKGTAAGGTKEAGAAPSPPPAKSGSGDGGTPAGG